jgi:uncharacterized membrane protein YhaH (DUF805 family)
VDVRAVYKWVATLVTIVLVLQVGFAGYGAFYAAHAIDKSKAVPKAVTENEFDHGFDPHIVDALVIILSILILLIVGLVAGVGRWRLGRHGVLALLLVLQVFLAGAAFDVPTFGFFHAVNAIVMIAVAGWVARDGWNASDEPGVPSGST